MALDPSRMSISPESSGRESPIPRQWRNQLGTEDSAPKDKAFRKYASGVERTLALFDTALQEWADYISFLNRLLKALQARSTSITTVPSRALVAKRLSQCLNPSLPSGVHQKTLEVYHYVFTMIGKDGLSRDLPLYLPGLASTLSFASLSVRSPFLALLERHFLELNPRSLRPAMKSIVLALLPGLEEETAEDFERTLKLLERFKVAIRPSDSEEITASHHTGDFFFWQCFLLASITSTSRRSGALAYLVRSLPKLGHPLESSRSRSNSQTGAAADVSSKLSQMVTSPEPGLLVRCFAAGLADDQLLIQRGYLDLLVTHLPLHSKVLQSRAAPADLELLLRAAAGVVTRREMSLNRRLWAWLLGPEPAAPSIDNESGLESPSSVSEHHGGFLASKTSYFEQYGLQPLSRSLLAIINAADEGSPADRVRPYRICLSLMDRWEIGGLVVPAVFLPIVDSVRRYKTKAPSKADFNEVLRSASVFFDGVESGLIYGELLGLVAQAIGPGSATAAERSDKLALVKFVIAHFNVREDEMVTIHAPLTALSIICMVTDAKGRKEYLPERTTSPSAPEHESALLLTKALGIAADLVDLIPERAFYAPMSSAAKKLSPDGSGGKAAAGSHFDDVSTVEILAKIKDFYVNDQGNMDASPTPFHRQHVGELLLRKACALTCESLLDQSQSAGFGVKSRIMLLLLIKTPTRAAFNVNDLLISAHDRLSPGQPPLEFLTFSSTLSLCTSLYTSARISLIELSELVPLLVSHAWDFLSASEPKYHVETVRNLWQLQTALGPQSRDIEAAIAGLMVRHDEPGSFASRPSDPGRSFAVLWSHTLQDSPSGSDRRGSRMPRTPNGEAPKFYIPRLAGADYYDVMLTRPLFLALDALLDERTQLFMTVKMWMNSMISVEKFFSIFVSKFRSLEFLQLPRAGSSIDTTLDLQIHDDLDLCLYFMRSLGQVLRWAPESMWTVLAKATVPADSSQPPVAHAEEGEVEGVTFVTFLLQVCVRCIVCDKDSGDDRFNERIMQLGRCALNVLHQILLNPFSESLADLHLEDVLIERLLQSLSGPDPYVQVLLLDVVFASLRLREAARQQEQPSSPITEKRPTPGVDSAKAVKRPSVSGDDLANAYGPPPSLLKCVQAGLSSASSRVVLDSWVSFLGVCLPLYSDSIFQVLIPLVETLCGQINGTFAGLKKLFKGPGKSESATETTIGGGSAPESTLISLLNALEQVLAKAHDRLMAEEARAALVKSPDQPQGFFGTIFSSDTPQARSATANDRLTVLLAFQDAVRICFKIWSWGQGVEAGTQDMVSAASFNFTSLRMRNRARRLLEHLFAAETLECLETVIDIWKGGPEQLGMEAEVLNLLPVLDSSRPRHTIPAIFNAIYSRTSPGSLGPGRKSTLTVELLDTDIVIFLVDYARSLEDDAMDEIWQDCMLFLKDLLGNPFPHRQTIPSLLEFAAILGEKVDNTNFGEQKKMRRELGDLFMRLLTALFTTRPMTFTDVVVSTEKPKASETAQRQTSTSGTGSPRSPSERAENVVGILTTIVPNLAKVLIESDRVLNAAGTISTSVIGPALRSKSFPETMNKNMLVLMQELSRIPSNQKTWRRDVAEAFNDPRFFGAALGLAQHDWLPLLRQWTVSDKERMPELVGRITPPATAGIVFGVGATSARLEADRRTQLNLRRIATLILASAMDTFVSELPSILEKLDELLVATPTSSPSSTTRAELFMVVRALVLKTNAVHLAPLWPVINNELHAAISSVVAADHSAASDTYNNASVLQACKLLDLLVCVAPDDFQLHEWLFVTDTIEAVYRSSSYRPVALADELSEELGSVMAPPGSATHHGGSESVAHMAATGSHRRTLLGGPGGLGEDVSMDRKDELVAKVLRPFFGQLSIFAFESTYAMGPVDWDHCTQGLLRDVFDERSIVRAL